MRSIFSLLFLVFSISAFSQTDLDALRYSRLQMIGSGRTMGVGGAFGALGGDFTVLSSNPAGIATYRHSEISITPSLVLNQTVSDFENNQSSSLEPYPNVSNFGLVLSNVNSTRGSKWKTTNFALGTNRLANYNQQFYFEGTSRGSITERYLELANGYTPDQLDGFEGGLAYDTYLIDNVSGSQTEYFTDADTNSFTFKNQDFSSNGYLNEFVISFGGNYMHRLYVGATLGLPFVRYNEQRTYREEDLDESIDFFNAMTYTERFLTTGLGVNLKIGAIYRLSQRIRLGAALHTPTALSLSDTYSTSMTSSITFNQQTGPEQFAEDSELGNYQYNLVTPWRAIGSAALLIGKKGFVTGEVEYINYSYANFNFNTFNVEDEAYLNELNGNIDQKYGSALNLRLGGELVFDKLRLRGGYAIYGSPFNQGVSFEDAIINNISIGAGYHAKGLFVDIAYVTQGRTEEYVPYVAENSPNVTVVTNDMNFTQVVLTIGFKFY